MKLRLSTYFVLAALLCTLIVTLRSPAVGAAYLLASAALVLPLFIFRVPRRYYFIALFAAGTLWVSHMIRPVVSLYGWANFMYVHIGPLTDERTIAALFGIALYGFLFEAGLLLGLIPIFGGPRETPPAEETHEVRKQSLLVRNRIFIIGGLIGFLLLRAGLLLGLDVGRKGDSNGSLGFILQLIPDEMIFAVAIIYLAKYRNEIGGSLAWVVGAILVGYSGTLLLGGSKAFLARIGLALFIYYLASRGDFKIRFDRAVMAGVFVVVALLLTFPLGTFVRAASKRSSGFGMEFVQRMRESIPQMLQPERRKMAVDMVTRRMSGFDGFVVVQMKRDPNVDEAFSVPATLRQTAGRFIPGFRAQSATQGKAVSVHYLGMPESVTHAGAVGLLGAAKLVAGGLAGVFLVVLGYLWGTFFRVVGNLRSRDLTFLLQYAGAYAVLRWALSGNFDDVLAMIIIQVIHILFYAAVAYMACSVARLLAEKPPAFASATA